MGEGGTIRQQIMQAITGAQRSARDLAHSLSIPERQVEDHLAHIAKTLAHDQEGRFLLEPSMCQDCGFIFRGRTRLTRPSRCPECHSEAITPPRFAIVFR
jgi:predicted Zn-ribbon and HTH transcriptional regulator